MKQSHSTPADLGGEDALLTSGQRARTCNSRYRPTRCSPCSVRRRDILLLIPSGGA